MKKSFYLILFILFIISCDTEFDIVNLNNNKIISLGHGGMGNSNIYPMNSFESIMKCLNQGIDGSELDVQMTKDSVLVAFHDKDLSKETNLSGQINSLNWHEIEDAYYTSLPYLKYSIISLDQLFSNINNVENYAFTFDCKLYNSNTDQNSFYESYINSMIKIIQKYQLGDNIQIESTNKVFLELFKSKKPDYRLFIYPDSIETGIDIALELDLYGIIIKDDNVTKEQIKTAHDNNIHVALWSVKSRSEHINAINKNPDFIQSDNIKYLVDFLK